MERFSALVTRPASRASSARIGSVSSPSLLDERFDHDSCGVGFVASIQAEPSHEILAHALTALARLAHRGATAADGKSSDGVGILTAVPREFLIRSENLSLSPSKTLGV